MQGIIYLHKRYWVHTQLAPEAICINKNKKQYAVLIHGFSAAMPLSNDENNRLKLTPSPSKPYLLDLPDSVANQNIDLRKMDMWSIGAMLYG
ncbi:hypothetical protein BDF19DRAFT_263356 [Syncephalis fuscata]|nr:hypothetical protein BDF19DRAFT_263356 [Syncephalis fuscata]